jgi:hypothetical protein
MVTSTDVMPVCGLWTASQTCSQVSSASSLMMVTGLGLSVLAIVTMYWVRVSAP